MAHMYIGVIGPPVVVAEGERSSRCAEIIVAGDRVDCDRRFKSDGHRRGHRRCRARDDRPPPRLTSASAATARLLQQQRGFKIAMKRRDRGSTSGDAE